MKAEMTIKAGTKMFMGLIPRLQQAETFPEKVLMSLALHESVKAVENSDKIIQNLKMPSKNKKIS